MFNAATAYRGGSAQFGLLQCVNMNEANYYLYGQWPSLRSIQTGMLQKDVSICIYHVPTLVTVFMYLHVFAIYQHL